MLERSEAVQRGDGYQAKQRLHPGQWRRKEEGVRLLQTLTELGLPSWTQLDSVPARMRRLVLRQRCMAAARLQRSLPRCATEGEGRP